MRDIGVVNADATSANLPSRICCRGGSGEISGYPRPRRCGGVPTAAWDCIRRRAVPCRALWHRGPASFHRHGGPQDRPPHAQNRRDASLPRRGDRFPECASAKCPRRCTSHLAAKSGDVLTVSTPAFCRCNSRSVPAAIRSSASRIDREIVAARFRDDQALALAAEQLDASSVSNALT